MYIGRWLAIPPIVSFTWTNREVDVGEIWQYSQGYASIRALFAISIFLEIWKTHESKKKVKKKKKGYRGKIEFANVCLRRESKKILESAK